MKQQKSLTSQLGYPTHVPDRVAAKFSQPGSNVPSWSMVRFIFTWGGMLQQLGHPEGLAVGAACQVGRLHASHACHASMGSLPSTSAMHTVGVRIGCTTVHSSQPFEHVRSINAMLRLVSLVWHQALQQALCHVRMQRSHAKPVSHWKISNSELESSHSNIKQASGRHKP